MSKYILTFLIRGKNFGDNSYCEISIETDQMTVDLFNSCVQKIKRENGNIESAILINSIKLLKKE